LLDLTDDVGLFVGEFHRLDLTVHEEIDHDIPWASALELSLEVKHLTGKEPVHHSKRKLTLVVAWNRNVDKLQRAVCVAKRNNWDVHVASLNKGVAVQAWVCNNEQTWLGELLGVLVRKGPWDPAIQNSALSVRTSTNGRDLVRVVYSSDNSCSEMDLFERLIDVNDMDTIHALVVNIGAHVVVDVLRSKVDGRC
jgi:hypothetical protein